MPRKKKYSFPMISVFGTIGVIGSIIGIIWCSFLWAKACGTLAIDEIVIRGATILNIDQYQRHIGDLTNNKPIQTNLLDIQRIVEEHPYIKAARVSHQYPSIIVIEISERKPIAILNGEPMVMLDSDGVVLPDIGNLIDFSIPILTNYNPAPELYPIGNRALSVKVMESISWLKILRRNYQELYYNLSEMTMENGGEIVLILADYPTRVALGNSHSWSKIEILKKFQQKIKGENLLSDFTYLDMRYKNQVIVKDRI